MTTDRKDILTRISHLADTRVADVADSLVDIAKEVARVLPILVRQERDMGSGYPSRSLPEPGGHGDDGYMPKLDEVDHAVMAAAVVDRIDRWRVEGLKIAADAHKEGVAYLFGRPPTCILCGFLIETGRIVRKDDEPCHYSCYQRDRRDAVKEQVTAP